MIWSKIPTLVCAFDKLLFFSFPHTRTYLNNNTTTHFPCTVLHQQEGVFKLPIDNVAQMKEITNNTILWPLCNRSWLMRWWYWQSFVNRNNRISRLQATVQSGTNIWYRRSWQMLAESRGRKGYVCAILQQFPTIFVLGVINRRVEIREQSLCIDKVTFAMVVYNVAVKLGTQWRKRCGFILMDKLQNHLNVDVCIDVHLEMYMVCKIFSLQELGPLKI